MIGNWVIEQCHDMMAHDVTIVKLQAAFGERIRGGGEAECK